MFKRRFTLAFLAAATVVCGSLLVAGYLAQAAENGQVSRTGVQQKQRLLPVKALGAIQPVAKPLGAPIAYGFVQYDGSLYATSGNVTAEWNATYHRYYIRITGVAYNRGTHITFVTPEGNGGVFFPATWEENGALVVCMGESSGSSGAQAGFQFMTYKLN